MRCVSSRHTPIGTLALHPPTLEVAERAVLVFLAGGPAVPQELRDRVDGQMDTSTSPLVARSLFPSAGIQRICARRLTRDYAGYLPSRVMVIGKVAISRRSFSSAPAARSQSFSRCSPTLVSGNPATDMMFRCVDAANLNGMLA